MPATRVIPPRTTPRYGRLRTRPDSEQEQGKEEQTKPPSTLRRAYYLWRAVLRTITLLLIPFFVLQAFAFVSFIYEEALQASGFACQQALTAIDETDPNAWEADLARQVIARYQLVLTRAKHFQAHWGKYAWWADDAYHTYFYLAAPAQLTGYYLRSVDKGVYYPPRRGDGEYPTSTIAELEANGFDPYIVLPDLQINPYTNANKPARR